MVTDKRRGNIDISISYYTGSKLASRGRGNILERDHDKDTRTQDQENKPSLTGAGLEARD
jgi:hypothetical protein